MELEEAHARASAIFFNFGLSYVFASKIIARNEADHPLLGHLELSGGRSGGESSATTSSALSENDKLDGWVSIDGSRDRLIRFSFSKPSILDPRPAIVVDMNLEVVCYNPPLDRWRYLVKVEGQRYSRLFEVSGVAKKKGNTNTASSGKEATPSPAFSEKWIDTVFNQKAAVLATKLWVR